ncbi:MAG TPA: ABC transporter ATP-binding protein [Nitriliruptorales bacterium]
MTRAAGGDGVVARLEGVVREHSRGQMTVRALDGVDLTVGRGQLLAVVGPSGAGKSTLLHLLGGLDAPDAGRVTVEGADLAALTSRQRAAFRRRRVGLVFQFFHLIPTLSAWENVALPRLLDEVPLRRSRDRACDLLAQVGLGHRLDHTPGELSGGEIQRVAIARALMPDPVLLLADEPTGNLDRDSGRDVIGLLRQAVDDHGTTVVLVTHDEAFAASADRRVRLVDGRVAGSGGTDR